MTLEQAKQHQEQNPHHPFKYYDMFGMISVAVLMISNIVAQKITHVGPFTVSVAILVFPITYIIGDIMTEVYGYARARRVTWVSVFCLILMVGMFQLAIASSHIAEWQNQAAFEAVLGNTPRIVFASLTAICVGELVNSFVLAKMKIWTKGRHLWARIIGSTVSGQAVDSAIFFTVAFAGVLPTPIVVSSALSGWFLKSMYEAVMTPVTYVVVDKLKRIEGVDFYDVDTNFTPFSLDIGAGEKK